MSSDNEEDNAVLSNDAAPRASPSPRPLFTADRSRLHNVSSEIQCGEDHASGDDGLEEYGSYTFYMSLPGLSKRLEFSCRDPSCGVLVNDEPSAEKIVDGRVDPFLFEPDYYLEAKTGFQVWPGSRLLVEALTCPKSYSDCPKLLAWQNRLACGANIVELGAGIGVVGACLAAAGGNVVITDLKTLVYNAIVPNLVRNGSEPVEEECPSWIKAASTVKDLAPNKIGRGWAGGAVIDWNVHLDSQLSSGVTSDIDIVLGCDCFWMKKLIDPVLNIVSSVFASSTKSPKFLVTYQVRGQNEVFSTIGDILVAVQERGWTAECHAWRPVTIGEDGANEVFLFEISP